MLSTRKPRSSNLVFREPEDNEKPRPRAGLFVVRLARMTPHDPIERHLSTIRVCRASRHRPQRGMLFGLAPRCGFGDAVAAGRSAGSAGPGTEDKDQR